MTFQTFGTNHLKGGTPPMYTPTHEDAAACRNAATLLSAFNRGVLAHQLAVLASHLEANLSGAHARRRAADVTPPAITEEMIADHPNVVQQIGLGSRGYTADHIAYDEAYWPAGDLGDDPDGDAAIDPRDT